jgi:hypothetical protein
MPKLSVEGIGEFEVLSGKRLVLVAPTSFRPLPANRLIARTFMSWSHRI